MKKKYKIAINFIINIWFCLKMVFISSKAYAIIRFTIVIISRLLPIVNIYISKLIIDVLTQGNLENDFNKFCLLILLLFIVLVIATSINKIENYVVKIQNEIMINTIERKTMKKASTIDLRFFDSTEYYDKLQLTKANTEAINKVVWELLNFISTFAALLVSFIIVWEYNNLISCLVIIAYLPLLIFEHIYMRKIYCNQADNVAEERKMLYLSEIISSRIHAKSVRFFGLSQYLLDTFKKIWTNWFGKRKTILKKWITVTLSLSVIPHFLTLFMLYCIGIDILNGLNTVGDFTFYSGIVMQIVSNLFLIVGSIINVGESIIRIKDFKDFLNIKNIVEDSGDNILEKINEIEFKDVSFIYPGNKDYTIKKINFRISGQDRIALIGVNGAGKTTIIKLVLRFYDPSEGMILINGIDIKEYSPKSIREQFSVMFQDYSNYAFSLRENLKTSDLQYNFEDDEFTKICKESGVYSFLKKWKNGLDTFLYKDFSNDGVELSGGQNQKVSLARMFSRNRNFLLLDEPSAALDPESEFRLINNIAKLCKDKGLIFITHKLSNLFLVNRILVLEYGEIIEDGTHEELIAKNGRYSKLYNQQANKYNATKK